MKDLRVRVIHIVENDDWMSAVVGMFGHQAETETPFSLEWLTMVRIQGDCIVKGYPSVDFLDFPGQVGQRPQDAFEL